MREFYTFIETLFRSNASGGVGESFGREKAKSYTNRRNRTSQKEVRSSMGKVELNTPLDIVGSYEPNIVNLTRLQKPN